MNERVDPVTSFTRLRREYRFRKQDCCEMLRRRIDCRPSGVRVQSDSLVIRIVAKKVYDEGPHACDKLLVRNRANRSRTNHWVVRSGIEVSVFAKLFYF